MKRMVTILLTMFMTLSLAACGVGGDSTTQSSSGQSGTVQSDNKAETLYTVTVKDQDGNGVSGCVVNFCNAASCSPVTADEKGVYSYIGEAYAYHVQVVKVPDGYRYDTSKEYTADKDGGNIDVTVTKE